MTNNKRTVVVIGGGAAGFFGAVTAAATFPDLEVVLLEKTSKLLAKVRVSGGGRCNVTHHCFQVSELLKNYPRGARHLRQPFEQFGVADCIAWFEKRGVQLKTEPDGRMFPVTDTSETILDCLLAEARKTGVQVRTSSSADRLEPTPHAGPNNRFLLHLSNGTTLPCYSVLVATGGNPKAAAYHWLQELGHAIEEPVPSLFTFNVPASGYQALQGVSVAQARVKVAGHKLEAEGPLLVTHWGFSGPAVLRTSAWGARLLHQLNYRFEAQISWVGTQTEEQVRAKLESYRAAHPKRVVATNPLFGLPIRLWKTLSELAGISAEIRWTDLNRKSQNKLLEELVRSPQQVQGKTTFKEEFVTAGGVSLLQVHMGTMQSRLLPGLFFAGEVLDIDGVTGGFNFQAAWATGFVAGKQLGL